MLSEGFDASESISPEEAFLILPILDQNMRLLTNDDWHSENSESENYLFAHGLSTLTEDQHRQIRIVKELIVSLCDMKGINLHNITDYAIRAKLLGAWINCQFGWHGMDYAINSRVQDYDNDVNTALDTL